MFKNWVLFSFLIPCTFFLNTCVKGTQKKYKIKYYQSGKVEIKGWYIKDTIPVDTLYTFYETGDILAIEIYDSIGNAMKSTSYFNNGNIHKTIEYKNGLANGFFNTYFESGAIKSRAFFVDDVQAGDTYYYTQGGTGVKAYSFFDWNERPINLMKFDTTTARIRFDTRQAIYLDSLQTLRVSSENGPTHKIQILISNPPKCLSIVKTEYISKSGVIAQIDSVIKLPYYVTQKHLPDSFSIIRISGIQFDSINRKTTYQRSNIKLYFPK